MDGAAGCGEPCLPPVTRPARVPRGAVGPPGCSVFGVRCSVSGVRLPLRRRLRQDGAPVRQPRGGEPHRRHQQPARQRHDPALPRTPVAGADVLPEPPRQCAVRLVVEPAPGHPRQMLSQHRAARLAGPRAWSTAPPGHGTFSASTVRSSVTTSSRRPGMPPISARSPGGSPVPQAVRMPPSRARYPFRAGSPGGMPCSLRSPATAFASRSRSRTSRSRLRSRRLPSSSATVGIRTGDIASLSPPSRDGGARTILRAPVRSVFAFLLRRTTSYAQRTGTDRGRWLCGSRGRIPVEKPSLAPAVLPVDAGSGNRTVTGTGAGDHDHRRRRNGRARAHPEHPPDRRDGTATNDTDGLRGAARLPGTAGRSGPSWRPRGG